MILAVDPGLATFGWAVVEPVTGRLVACGVLVQKPNPKLTVTKCRLHRASAQAAKVQQVASLHMVRAIVAESMSFAPRSSANAKIGIGMSWGVLLGAAAVRGIPFCDVTPKTWQHAILPEHTGAIDYDMIFAALSTYVDPKASGLDAVPLGQRNHALDAVGVGVYAAVMLEVGATWKGAA